MSYPFRRAPHVPEPDPFLEKPLPRNLEAERAVLGGVILVPETWEQAQILKHADFYDGSNGKIFEAIKHICTNPRMHQRTESNGQTVYGLDPLTLQEELRRRGDLGDVGGPAYIASLFDGLPRYSNIEEHIRIVKHKARMRRFILAAARAVARAFDDEEETVDTHINRIEVEMVEIGTDYTSASPWHAASDAASRYLNKVEQRRESNRPVVGYSTGFYGLDRNTLGLEKKTHTIVGARPGVGKTAFGMALTLHMQVSNWNVDAHGRPPVVGWFSMEMTEEQLSQRVIATIAGVDARELHLGRLSSEQWRRVADAEQILANMRIFFDDRCGLSVPMMRQAARRIKQDEGSLDVLIIDYLQLGDGETNGRENRQQEVSRFCGGVTEMGKQMDLCVISLAQLNRNANNSRPTLADFRESGRLEQDAHTAIGLHRDMEPQQDSGQEENEQHQHSDGPVEPPPESQDAELIIMKSRGGPPTTVSIGFVGSRYWFYEKQRSEERWQEMLNRFRVRT
jgi:replicative DNA helicase